MNSSEICKTEYCTGCAACMNCCQKGAINMQADDKGFLRPVIDDSICINCGLCMKTCPQNKRVAPRREGKTFAALATNDELRSKSSSGGIFSLLAEQILNEGGIVFGASMCEDLKVRHVLVDSICYLSFLHGSKYVQSEIGDSYRQTQKYLEKGKKVLFSGTPCQIDALYHFLRKDYENLLTIGILCHGVPSPSVFQKFIESKEEKTGRKIKSINFRDKDPGWSSFSTTIYYSDGTKEIDNSYYYFFVQDYCLRDSCYHCLYSDTKRIEDLTLGDYWGYRESGPEHIENDDRGISLVFVNTKKAEKAFYKARRKMNYAARTKDDAKKSNRILVQPFKPNEKSEMFWMDFPVLTWNELVDKYNISREKKKDYMPLEERLYYSKPYKQRHLRHLIHCVKLSFINGLSLRR